MSVIEELQHFNTTLSSKNMTMIQKDVLAFLVQLYYHQLRGL